MKNYALEKVKDEYYNRPKLGAWIALTIAIAVLFCMLMITIVYKITKKPSEIKVPENTYFAKGEANKKSLTVYTTPHDANRGSYKNS